MARTSGTNRGMWWGIGGAAAVVIALTLYAALSGGSHNTTTQHHGGPSTPPSSGPVPTYTTPPDWTEPDRWLALPRGAHTTINGLQTGFPDTTDGAVAMLVNASAMNVEGSQTATGAQLTTFNTYMAAADRNAASEEKAKEHAEASQESLRRGMGLSTTGPWPAGAFVHMNVVGFKVIQASPDEVTAYLLTEVSKKAGETQPEKDSYVSAVLGAAWQGGDWQLSGKAIGDAAQQTQGQQGPAIAAPGDATFNTTGWTAIRQAS